MGWNFSGRSLCLMLAAGVLGTLPQNAICEPTAGLPETAMQTFMDPCLNIPLSGVRAAEQRHDGVRFNFNGGSATESVLWGLYYQQHGGSVYTCQKNPHTERLSANPELVANLGWGRQGNSLDSQLAGAAAKLDREFDSGRDACWACYLARNSHGCFPPGVKIATDADGNTVNVEDVAVGDVLWNPMLQKGARVLAIVEGFEKLPMISVGIDGAALTVSQEHPMLTKNGMKMAKHLSLGDYLYDGSGDLHLVTSLSAAAMNDGQRVINFILSADSDSTDERLVLADGIVTGDLTIQRALSQIHQTGK